MSNGKDCFGFDKGFNVFGQDSTDIPEQVFPGFESRFKDSFSGLYFGK